MSSSKRHKVNEEVSFHLNRDYAGEDFKKRLAASWSKREDKYSDDSVHLTTTPFPCCVLMDFVEKSGGLLEGKEGLVELKEELMKLKLHQKNNDLYQFKQSDDLKSISSSHIKAFCDLLSNQCLPLIRDITGIPLNDVIDATCSKYEYTDVLLCHDDRLEGRRIAFIYYLVPPSWCEGDGGSLDLFRTNECLNPVQVVHSIVPKWNSLVFFEVSPASFHQVSEVLSGSKARLTINGWFHGPPVEYPVIANQSPSMSTLVPKDVSILEAWVNPLYLDVGTAAQVREEFEENSQIELQCFLLEDKYELLCTSLDQASIQWEESGAPDKQLFHVSNSKNWSGAVQELMDLMCSEAIGLLLTHLTGVELVREEGDVPTSSQSVHKEECVGLCRESLVKVQKGSYSLACNTDSEDKQYCLEGMLFFRAEEWSSDCGGFLTYIARDEDEELLTVMPASNSLALVYRDKDTLRFLKYVNNRVFDREIPYYYMASLRYEEAFPDEE